MQLSYWEYSTWLSNIDFAIVGSGITGLNCALYLRKRYPKAKIVILEKGILPQGASTKNAGFACFGSISEILSDLKTHSEEEVAQLVRQRWEGIQLLRKNLGDKTIDFQLLGGYELFLDTDEARYETCIQKINDANQLLEQVFGGAPFQVYPNSFNFKKVQQQYIAHNFEGQLNTGKMMRALLKLVTDSGTTILNSVTVESYVEGNGNVTIKTDRFQCKAKKLLIATNGFASKLIGENVKPARAQVLVTKPIKNLRVRGTFHLDEGYYYFRNIDDRILFGGGRNLDFSTEETTNFGLTAVVQNRLEKMLQEIILPRQEFEIERQWSGIMGIGHQKKPIVKPLSPNVYCGVRLGGMGVAIGSSIGRKLAGLV